TSDSSDTGPDPESRNLGEEGDTGGEADPTCVNIPMINMTKTCLEVEDSPFPGQFVANFEMIIENTGNVALDSIIVKENFMQHYGPYFQAVESVEIVSSDATVGIALNPNFDGKTDTLITIPQDSTVFEPGQRIVLLVRPRIDPVIGNMVADTLFNQASVWARGVSPTALANPMPNQDDGLKDAYNKNIWTGDKSDPGDDPEGLNAGVIGDEGTGDDFSPILPCWIYCEAACNDKVNASLGPDCSIYLTADMFMEGIEDFECQKKGFFQVVNIRDKWGGRVPNPVTQEYLNQELIVTVENIVCENPCWSKVLIQDKYPPQIECENDTIFCWDPIPTERELTAILSNNCDGYPVRVNILYETWEEIECEVNDLRPEVEMPDPAVFSGVVTRRIQTSDIWGNSNECTQVILIKRADIDSVQLVDKDPLEIECNYIEPGGGLFSDLRNSVFQGSSGTRTSLANIYYDKHVRRDTINGKVYLIPLPVCYRSPEGNVEEVLGGVEGSEFQEASQPGVKKAYVLNDGMYWPRPPQLIVDRDTAWIWPTDLPSTREKNFGRCKIYTHFKDHIIPTCGHTYKIRREWKIVDWCANEGEGKDTTLYQYIKIVDTQPPEAPDLWSSSSGYSHEPFEVSEWDAIDDPGQCNGDHSHCDEYYQYFKGYYAHGEHQPACGDWYYRRVDPYYVDAHECKAHVIVEPLDMIECWDG
ncbi:MAG: hypothetical protein R3330_07785, partial [Saprospiraceae bacterium]|nr:hypothetical protein [Saprospiraceae bacterium]